MKIGFDFDRVFINYPPFVPPSLIDWLYRRHGKKTLNYSIPRSLHSKIIRRLSHIAIFRPKIHKNIEFVKNFPHNPHPHQLYLISSRFKFLEKITHELLKTTGLADVFHTVYLNTKNRQPHFFKEDVIKENKIELYIDDDLLLLKHLHKTCPNTKLLWYNPDNRPYPHNGITPIRNLDEVTKFIR
ncbi:hypothetical protein HY385_02220 [Candidatus Daviesbacteria bacterium]|nr:hypothetical protein [Candidatus Daviesbacteria bacterium]